MEIKTEPDSDDITEHPHDDTPSTGILFFLYCFFLLLHSVHKMCTVLAFLLQYMSRVLSVIRYQSNCFLLLFIAYLICILYIFCYA